MEDFSAALPKRDRVNTEKIMQGNTEDAERINRWIHKELRNPKMEGDGRNNQMIRVMPRMLEIGWTDEEIFDSFKKAFALTDDISKDDEIWSVLANAAKYARNSPNRGTKADRELSMRLSEVRRASKRLLPKVLRKYRASSKEFTSNGWRNLAPDVQRRLFLKRMFRPEEVIWSGGKFDSGRPAHSDHFRPASYWLRAPRGWSFVSHCSFKPGSFSRCNESILERRYLVVESDSLARDQVFSLFHWFQMERGLELRAAVFSGNRSVHGWFDWPVGNDAREIGAMLEGFQCDPATIRGSQPVRLAGSTRPDTRKVQELLYLDAPRQ